MTRARAIVVTLAVLAAGCGRPDPPPRGIKGGDGILRLSFVGEPQTLNPNGGPDEHALLVGQNLFNRLVSLGIDGSLLPDLASRWEESPDGVTYTFHLRSDVRWHDGRSFTAEDVLVTFARVVEESTNRAVATRIADVSAPDDHTVVIRLKAPWAAFLPTLAWFGTSILPAHVYGRAAWRDHPANMRPVGTGPFRFKAWEPGVRIVLEKNNQYFGPGPYVDALHYLFARTPDEAADLLVEDKADLLVGRAPVQRLRQLAREPGVRVIMAPADARTYLGLNLRRPPFQDVRIRRAINLAMDRRALVDRGLAGVGAPALGFYTPAVEWAYNGEARVPAYDPATARRLLARLLPPGFVATLVCLAGSMDLLVEEVARQLEAAGLRVVTHCVPPAEYFDRVFTTREFDLALMSGSQGPDPDNLAARFGSAGTFQFMGYSNPELDAELERGASHTDVAIRAAAYHRVQEILAADLPIVPLAEGVRVTVVRSGIRGLPQDDARDLVPEHTYNLVRRARSER